MKKYVSILLAAILGASLLAGCGGSGKSGQQPAKEAQEQAAQPEETKTEEAGSVEDAAQADEAKDDAKADAAAAEDDPQTDAAASKDGLQADVDTAADSDAYLVYVKDAETMAPMPGVNVQFCSDVMCQMGKTDENGVAAFHSDPGTYTVHLMKAPDGYVSSTEEFTLDQDNREATWLLEKQKTEPEPGADTDPVGSENSDSEMDFPYAGFTFTVPEEFKEVTGEIRTNDFGEVGVDSGIVIGYVAYQAKTEAAFMEFLETAGINPEDDEMIAEAKKILEEHGVTFPNVHMTEEIREQLPTTGLPTSYFVDSEGNILGRPIIGAYEEQYDEALENLLSGME